MTKIIETFEPIITAFKIIPYLIMIGVILGMIFGIPICIVIIMIKLANLITF